MKHSTACYLIAAGLVISVLDVPAIALRFAQIEPDRYLLFSLIFGFNALGYGLIFWGARSLEADSPFFRRAEWTTAAQLVCYACLAILALLQMWDLDPGARTIGLFFLPLMFTIDWFMVYALCKGIQVEARSARKEAVQIVEWMWKHLLLRDRKAESAHDQFSILEREADRVWVIYLSISITFIPFALYLWSYLIRKEQLWPAIILIFLHFIPAVGLAYFIFRVGQLLEQDPMPPPPKHPMEV